MVEEGRQGERLREGDEETVTEENIYRERRRRRRRGEEREKGRKGGRTVGGGEVWKLEGRWRSHVTRWEEKRASIQGGRA